MFLLPAKSNKRWIRRDLRKRAEFYWLHVDAFGRNPSPPKLIMSTPAALIDGVWYVAQMEPIGRSHKTLSDEHDYFKKALAKLTGKEPSTLGFITWVPGWFNNHLTIRILPVHDYVILTLLH